MSNWKMRREEVIKLITYYRKHKCLWDFRSMEYKRYDMKKDAWQRLAKIFRKEVNDVKRKIKHLRSAYVAEKKRVDDSYGTNQVHQPNLFYYNDLDFLDSIIVCRNGPRLPTYEQKSESGGHFDVKPVENIFNEQYVSMDEAVPQQSPSPPSPSPPSSSPPSPSPPPPSPPRRAADSHLKMKKKQHRLSSYYSNLNSAINILAEVTKTTPQDSIYTAFGKTIALQLSQLPQLEATSTMSEIHQILSKNIIQSMLSKNDGQSYKNSRRAQVEHVDSKLSILKTFAENGMEANNSPIEFDEVSM